MREFKEAKNMQSKEINNYLWHRKLAIIVNRIMLGILIFICGVLIFHFVVENSFSKHLVFWTLLSAIFIMPFGIGFLISEYLKKDSTYQRRIDNEKEISSLNISVHQNQSPENASLIINSPAIDDLKYKEANSSNVDLKVAADRIFNYKNDESLVDNKEWHLILRTFSRSQKRLLSEIDSLGRRGNVNLVVGVMTTVFAIGLLAYLVLWNYQKLDDVPSVIAHYVPRITLVIFVEVFSFFFLRLYRTSLNEIRMYQEDITRLAIQEVAVISAWAISDESARAKLSASLIASTKNSLTKPEGGSDLASNVDLIERLAKIFSRMRGEEKLN